MCTLGCAKVPGDRHGLVQDRKPVIGNRLGVLAHLVRDEQAAKQGAESDKATSQYETGREDYY